MSPMPALFIFHFAKCPWSLTFFHYNLLLLLQRPFIYHCLFRNLSFSKSDVMLHVNFSPD